MQPCGIGRRSVVANSPKLATTPGPPRSEVVGKAFFQDHSRIRIKPGHFARLRSFALNILRANGAQNISRELYINALNLNHALAYTVT